MNLVKDPDCDNMRIDACDLEDIVIKSLFDFTKNITSVGKTIGIKWSAISELQKKDDPN